MDKGLYSVPNNFKIGLKFLTLFVCHSVGTRVACNLSVNSRETGKERKDKPRAKDED